MSSRRIANLRERLIAIRPERRRIVTELVFACRDCEFPADVRARAAERLDEIAEGSGVRFGVVEVLAIIRLVIAIWRWVDDQGWLETATPKFIEDTLGVN